MTENSDFKTQYLSPDIKLSKYDGRIFKTEVIFEHHMLVWFISGETKIILADDTYIFGSGDIFLIPRNQLATVMNYPKDGKPHQTVVMQLTKNRLKEFYLKYKSLSQAVPFQKIRIFNSHPLLQSCMASVVPYFDLKDKLPEVIASIKIEEAINILRSIDQETDSLLANFEEPGKIDLAGFMEKNFMFNMPLEKFGYLTGRSLSTFKRDFRRTFNVSPQKWLTRKRLELAFYQLTEKNKNPAEIYFEVGFENLSHFSFAFKKQFGYSPTHLIATSTFV
jgi:AraC-like DNA-binding protein